MFDEQVSTNFWSCIVGFFPSDSRMWELRSGVFFYTCFVRLARVKVVYIAHSGQRIPVKAHVEDNILYPSHMYVHDQRHEFLKRLKCAYESSWACSTCHVYLPHNMILPPPCFTDDVLDMIILTPELDGIGVTLPKVTRNFYVDGHMPAHH
uniref:Uncharacterized protein n=1 Tax=Salmo trutta TaxID=8032 RepID=A0A673Y3R1_SALTR